jgi:hypothetical protein
MSDIIRVIPVGIERLPLLDSPTRLREAERVPAKKPVRRVVPVEAPERVENAIDADFDPNEADTVEISDNARRLLAEKRDRTE